MWLEKGSYLNLPHSLFFWAVGLISGWDPAFTSFQSDIAFLLRDIFPCFDFRWRRENCFFIPSTYKTWVYGFWVCCRGEFFTVVSGRVGQVLNRYIMKIEIFIYLFINCKHPVVENFRKTAKRLSHKLLHSVSLSLSPSLKQLILWWKFSWRFWISTTCSWEHFQINQIQQSNAGTGFRVSIHSNVANSIGYDPWENSNLTLKLAHFYTGC